MSSSALAARRRGLIGLVLVVVLVLLAAVVSVLAVRRGDLTTTPYSLSNDGRPILTAAEREKILTAAEAFCLRVDEVDGDNPEEYRKAVSALLTASYRRDFEQTFDEITKLGVQKGVTGKGRIRSSGIVTADRDSARVIVAHDVESTDGTNTASNSLRWSVELDKVDGTWLISNYEPVG